MINLEALATAGLTRLSQSPATLHIVTVRDLVQKSATSLAGRGIKELAALAFIKEKFDYDADEIVENEEISTIRQDLLLLAQGLL